MGLYKPAKLKLLFNLPKNDTLIMRQFNLREK